MKNGKLEGKDIENIYWLIAEKYKTERKGIFLYKNAFLLGNLMMRLNNGTPIGRSANGLIKKIKANNFVFVPACKEDDHWTLLIYDKENKTFHHYNSWKGIHNLKYFSSLLKGDMLGTDKNNVEEHNTPQQDDGVSCGLYVVAITEFLIKRYQNSAVMTWEINNKEAEEIKKNVLIFKKMLVDDKDYFNDLDLSTEITQKRKAKLERIHQMIARTKSVLNKAKMAEKELEQFAKDLKTSVNSPNDNVEKLVREEKKGGTKQIITIPIIPIILSAFYNSYFSKNYLKPNHEPKPRSKKINQGENIP